MKRRHNIFVTVGLLFAMLVMYGCKEHAEKPVIVAQPTVTNGIDSIIKRGNLRVITMVSATSYYVDKAGNEYGFDYDLARNFADYLDVDMTLVLAKDMNDMRQKLVEGKGDLIAYRMPCSSLNKKQFECVNILDPVQLVLVQYKGSRKVTDVTELIGKKVYVRKNSSYWRRLKHLNDELGGGIIIKTVPDSVTVSGLIYRVSTQKIKYTVAENYYSEVSSPYMQNLDFSVPVGLPQKESWLVLKSEPQLYDTLNVWVQSIKNSAFWHLLDRKYFEHNSYFAKYRLKIPIGAISPFDSVFKKYAPKLGWDWRLLAAVSWRESQFDPYAVSAVGALGLMQMMPFTAEKYGLDSSKIHEPGPSIEAGMQYFKYLDMIFKRIENKDERIKFVLAGYNAGPGHVLDAMALAKKYNYNPQLWNHNVDSCLLKLKYPKYYNDSVCNNGYFVGNHTVRYVDDVLKTYDKFLKRRN